MAAKALLACLSLSACMSSYRPLDAQNPDLYLDLGPKRLSGVAFQLDCWKQVDHQRREDEVMCERLAELLRQQGGELFATGDETADAATLALPRLAIRTIAEYKRRDTRNLWLNILGCMSAYIFCGKTEEIFDVHLELMGSEGQLLATGQYQALFTHYVGWGYLFEYYLDGSGSGEERTSEDFYRVLTGLLSPHVRSRTAGLAKDADQAQPQASGGPQ